MADSGPNHLPRPHLHTPLCGDVVSAQELGGTETSDCGSITHPPPPHVGPLRKRVALPLPLSVWVWASRALLATPTVPEEPRPHHEPQAPVGLMLTVP